MAFPVPAHEQRHVARVLRHGGAHLFVQVAMRGLRLRVVHVRFAEVGDLLAEHQRQAGHAQQQQEERADQAGPLVDQEPGFDGGTLH